MIESTIINNIQIKGKILNNKFNGEVLVQINDKEEKYIMKNGMIILINSLQRVNGYSNTLHYTYDRNSKIDKIVNNYQYIISQLKVETDYVIHAETIESVLKEDQNPILLEKIINLLTEKSHDLITIGFIDTITGECLSLFQILTKAKVFQMILSNICCGNELFSMIGKRVIQEYFTIDISKDFGYIFGTIMDMIIAEQIELEEKQYLLETFLIILEKCLVATEIQHDILFMIDNLRNDWKRMNDKDMKYVFVNNNSQLVNELFELYTIHFTNPIENCEEIKKEIEMINEKNEMKIGNEMIKIIENCFVVIQMKMIEKWKNDLELFLELTSSVNGNQLQTKEMIKNMLEPIQSLLYKENEEEQSLEKERLPISSTNGNESKNEVDFDFEEFDNDIDIEQFEEKEILDEDDDHSENSALSDSEDESIESIESIEISEVSEDDTIENDDNFDDNSIESEYKIFNEKEINQSTTYQNNFYITKGKRIISTDHLNKFIKEGNLDLFHLLQMDDHNTFSIQLIHLFKSIKFTWENKALFSSMKNSIRLLHNIDIEESE